MGSHVVGNNGCRYFVVLRRSQKRRTMEKDIYFFFFFFFSFLPSRWKPWSPLHRNKLRIYEQKMKAIIRHGLTFFMEEDRYLQRGGADYLNSHMGQSVTIDNTCQ